MFNGGQDFSYSGIRTGEPLPKPNMQMQKHYRSAAAIVRKDPYVGSAEEKMKVAEEMAIEDAYVEFDTKGRCKTVAKLYQDIDAKVIDSSYSIPQRIFTARAKLTHKMVGEDGKSEVMKSLVDIPSWTETYIGLRQKCAIVRRLWRDAGMSYTQYMKASTIEKSDSKQFLKPEQILRMRAYERWTEVYLDASNNVLHLDDLMRQNGIKSKGQHEQHEKQTATNVPRMLNTRMDTGSGMSAWDSAISKAHHHISGHEKNSKESWGNIRAMLHEKTRNEMKNHPHHNHPTTAASGMYCNCEDPIPVPLGSSMYCDCDNPIIQPASSSFCTCSDPVPMMQTANGR